MSMIYLPWGVLIGLIVAAPVGPVNIICIRRALSRGAMNGFVVGMGAAAADGLFGAIAAFGLTSVTLILQQTNGWIEIIGGLILLGVSVFLWRTHPHLDNVKDSYRDRFRAALGTFLLTMTNPMTILGFVAIFASLGLGGMGQNYANALLITLGIFLGSTLWWAIISRGAGRLKRRLTDKHLSRINRISAVIVGGFGLYALLHNFF